MTRVVINPDHEALAHLCGREGTITKRWTQHNKVPRVRGTVKITGPDLIDREEPMVAIQLDSGGEIIFPEGDPQYTELPKDDDGSQG